MLILRYVVAICISALSVNALAGWVAMAAETSPKGTMIVNGESVEFSHIYAYAMKEGFYDKADPAWSLILVDRPIEERDLDDPIWDAAYIRINITKTAEFGGEPKVQAYSQDIRFFADSGGNVSGGTYPEVELSSTGPEVFEGRIYLTEPQQISDNTFHYDFTFSIPLSDPFAPIGDPLPKGGGEPGVACLAWISAVHSGDIEKIKSLVTAEQAEMMEQEGFPAEDLEFLQSMTPSQVEILGGSIDGETAILQATGTMDGEEVSLEITLVLMDGRWIATDFSF